MAYQSVNANQKNFVTTKKWKEFQKGDTLEAIYKDVGNHSDKYGKDIYEFELVAPHAQYKAGEMIYLNCGGNLKGLMDQVEIGTKVVILYKGMTKMGPKTKHPGTLTHDIDVQVDKEENTSDDLI